MGEYRCPQGFQLRPPNTCWKECPADKGFEFKYENGNATCVYKEDPTFFLDLVPVLAVRLARGSPAPTMQRLRTIDQYLFNEYRKEVDRFNKEFPVLFARIDKDVKAKNAFKELQAAENVRDQSPQAYQDARRRYYTLIQGESWNNEESQRIAKSEVEPKVNQYMNSFTDMTQRINQQKKTIDVVNGVQDKVLSLRDDFKYSVDTFGKQLGMLKAQINMERRKRENNEIDIWTWADTLMNALLIITLLVAVFVLYRKVYTSTNVNNNALPYGLSRTR